jgi:Domain of unknown function (DUF4200)
VAGEAAVRGGFAGGRVQTALINYNAIIQNNETKRQRAKLKAESERTAREMRDTEVDALREEIRAERTRFERARARLERVRRFRDYLSRVMEASDDFSEIGAIEARYRTLEEAKRRLQAESSLKGAEVDVLRRKVDVLRSETAQTRLTSTLTTSSLGHEFEAATTRAEEAVRLEDDSAARQRAQQSEISAALNAIANLYVRCTRGEFGRHLNHEATIAFSSGAAISGAAISGADIGSASSSSSAPSAPTTATTASSVASSTLAELRERMQAAEQQVEVVGAYVESFREIVLGWRKGSALHSTAGAAAAGAAGATGGAAGGAVGATGAATAASSSARSPMRTAVSSAAVAATTPGATGATGALGATGATAPLTSPVAPSWTGAPGVGVSRVGFGAVGASAKAKAPSGAFLIRRGLVDDDDQDGTAAAGTAAGPAQDATEARFGAVARSGGEYGKTKWTTTTDSIAVSSRP